MTTHKLLLLPGDGIGPEVMGEVERLIGWLNAQGAAKIETEKDWSADAVMTPTRLRSPTRRWRWRRPRTQSFSVRWADRSGTRCHTTRGPRPVCCAFARISNCSPICVLRSAIRHLPTHRAAPRDRRGSRHHDVRELDGRRLFRRAENHHRSRQRTEGAPSTRRSMTPTRSSVSRASPSIWRAGAQ